MIQCLHNSHVNIMSRVIPAEAGILKLAEVARLAVSEAEGKRFRITTWYFDFNLLLVGYTGPYLATVRSSVMAV